MKLTNTHISKDCTRKVLVYVDNNGHYHIEKREATYGISLIKKQGKTKFKHIESCNRAVQKWLSTGMPL